MELFTAVEVFTQVITYVMIAAAVPPCLSMLQSGSTRGVPYPFFLAGTVNAVMGVGYGFLVNNNTFVQINTISIMFNTFYIGSFLYSSQRKSPPLNQLGACALFLGVVYIYVAKIVSSEKQMDNIGSIMLICSTILVLTPLLQVKQCIAEKSAASLSLVMLISGFFCCGAWLAYGLLLKDLYIYGPNLIGIMVYVCQFGVLATYGRGQAQSSHRD